MKKKLSLVLIIILLICVITLLYYNYKSTNIDEFSYIIAQDDSRYDEESENKVMTTALYTFDKKNICVSGIIYMNFADAESLQNTYESIKLAEKSNQAEILDYSIENNILKYTSKQYIGISKDKFIELLENSWNIYKMY